MSGIAQAPETLASGEAAAADPAITRKSDLRSRLFRKYFVLIISLVCGVLLLSIGTSLFFAYEEQVGAIGMVQQEKAKSAAFRIEQFLRQIEQEVGFAALAQLGASANEQRRLEFLKLMRLVPSVTDITYVDAAGREQIAVSRLAMDALGSGRDRSGEPAFRNAKPGGTWFGPVYFRKDTEPYMTIAIRGQAENAPVTIAEVNLKFMLDVITAIKVGEKGKAYVVDGSGHLIADPDIGLVLRKTDLSSQEHVKLALKQERGGTEIPGMVVSFATVGPTGWKVFAEQPTSEVRAPLTTLVVRNAALLALALVVSALAALFLARSMVRPIRALQEGAQRIGSGELGQRLDVKSGDELESLAGEFNRMSERLEEYYASLERKVEERTRDLAEALEHQTATAEILRVISGSPTEVQPVLDAVAQRAASLCDGGAAAVYLREEGGMMRRAGVHGDLALDGESTVRPLNPLALVDRAVCELRTIHVDDLHHERHLYPLSWNLAERLMREKGLPAHHTIVAVPLIRKGAAVGALVVRRTEVRPFTDKQVALLQMFADQAVIAIENVRLFNEIQEKSRQLEIANKHKTEFLANMSHELRTPLNAIIGFSEVLSDRMFGELNDDQAEFAGDIHESGKHLLSLINDILDLSKVEAGRMELVPTEFEIASAIDNALLLVKERAGRHGISLTTELDPALGTIVADERKLKQILVNLLSNAVKFTPEGGQVAVNARAVEGGIEIAVADNGVGIAKEDQEAVFEEFRQVGKDYLRKAEGTGLGLALARKFAVLHGGHIRLESEPGKGSTFTVFLPMQPAREAIAHE